MVRVTAGLRVCCVHRVCLRLQGGAQSQRLWGGGLMAPMLHTLCCCCSSLPSLQLCFFFCKSDFLSLFFFLLSVTSREKFNSY